MKNKRLEIISLLNKVVDVAKFELAQADVVTKEQPDIELRISLDQLRRTIENEPEYKEALTTGQAQWVPVAIAVIQRLKEEVRSERDIIKMIKEKR